MIICRSLFIFTLRCGAVLYLTALQIDYLELWEESVSLPTIGKIKAALYNSSSNDSDSSNSSSSIRSSRADGGGGLNAHLYGKGYLLRLLNYVTSATGQSL